ncbi:MAG: metal-sensitive transcriptional regulator [Patescibacteria group bacterium]
MIDPYKTKALNRLKKAKGQVDGIIKMIEENRYCMNIVTQTLALQGAIKSINELVLESHLNTCGIHLTEKDEKKRQEFIKEIVKAFELSKR